MKRNTLFNRVEWWLVIFVFLLGASVAFRSHTAIFRFFSNDDAYYYFQTARNFVNGHGISFDGIARANGYHPLWMLVCFPVFAFANLNIWLPLRILVVIQSALHATGGLFLYKTLRLHLSKTISLLLMATWLFSISIYRISGTMGLESGLNAFFMILLLYAVVRYEEGRPLKLGKITGLWLLGILAALALLSRLDNIFLVGLVGIWLILKDKEIDRRLVIADIFLSAFSVFFIHFLLFGNNNSYFNLMDSIKYMTVLSCLLFPTTLLFTGMSNKRMAFQRTNWRELLFATFALITASIVFILIVSAAFSGGGFSHRALILTALLLVIAPILTRGILHRFGDRKSRKPPLKNNDLLSSIQILFSNHIFKDAFAYLTPLILALVSFLSFNRLYFGAMMPISGKIKEWWSGLDTVYGRRAGNSVTFFGFQRNGPWNFFTDPLHDLSHWLNRYLDLAPNLLFYTFLFLLLVLSAVLLLRTKTTRRHLIQFAILPLSIGILFHTGYYMMTGYIGYREWYWLPQTLLVLILLGLLLAAISDGWEKNQTSKRVTDWCAVALILVLFLSFNSWHYQTYPWQQSAAADPLWHVRELESMTEEGSLIGMTGGGDVGYFIENRTIVNLDGLINGVEYFEHLQSFTANQYLDRIGLDYIYSRPYVILQSDPYQRMFQELLSPVALIGDMTLYRYLP